MVRDSLVNHMFDSSSFVGEASIYYCGDTLGFVGEASVHYCGDIRLRWEGIGLLLRGHWDLLDYY